MTVLFSVPLIGDAVLEIVQGDLTEERVDAIVNAANDRLQHGGGVAGAIVRKGGFVIQEESDRIGHVPTGEAVATGGGRLSAAFVIHAVGPVWRDGRHGEEELLASAVRASLRCATEHGLESIAIPAISSGIFGFPKKRCAEIILETIRMFISSSTTSLRRIRCTNIDAETAGIFRETAAKLYNDDFDQKGSA